MKPFKKRQILSIKKIQNDFWETFYPNVYIKADLVHYLPSSSLTPLLKYPCFSCGFGLVPKNDDNNTSFCHLTGKKLLLLLTDCLSDINLIAENKKKQKVTSAI